MRDKKRVVLAYSGGVDTTACIPYLRHQMGCEYIVAMAADLGQGEELSVLQQKAISAGADESIVLDVRERFVVDFGFTALQANAMYDRHYPLSSALGRPLIGELLVETARAYGCGSVAHGATGKGNDQIRMDMAVQLLDPSLQILAPAREWPFSRSDTIAFSEAHGIAPHVTKERPWAIDLNVLGRNIEAGPIEDLLWEPTEEVWAMTAGPDDTPDVADYVSIGFTHGIPDSIDGRAYEPVALVQELNRIAGRHGVGRIDMIENRVVGVKSRELYEAPGISVLLLAHAELENLTLPPDVLSQKHMIDVAYAHLIYEGFWHGPLREAFSAFVEATQRNVTGVIGVRLHRGSARVVTRSSENSLYRHDLVTYGSSCRFDETSAVGFIDIFGLSSRVWASAQAHS